MKKYMLLILLPLIIANALVSAVYADIPGRITPAGPALTGTSGANPGTQQQELPNITFPAPYNVFEFVVTCMACHGGTVDQTAGHGANWGGSNMASAMRDPIFRANEVLVNNTIKNLGAGDGAGNVCMRCHSPNGWLSGRFDPILGGAADGSDTIQSILLSTDTEGISCEMCHRVTGNVTHSRMTTEIDTLTGLAILTDRVGDPAFNMLEGVSDWPHLGNPYPQGPIPGEPLGDSTLQFHDGMGYGGKYSGSFIPYFSDVPLIGDYTGQTWGYNPDTPGVPFINPDGSYSFQFDELIGPPEDDTLYAISIEHPTREGSFVKTPEFCGSCHDLTVPVLNHGMPEQRTYTEWKYSDYGNDLSPNYKRCQDCHMPTMKHEYADNMFVPVTLNVDPTLAGWYPYGRDRNPNGGTAFHKLVGANRDLPQMMKFLYPEVDLEVIGAPTGHDPTIFPGMLSDRGPMWDRATRNTDVSLRDAASIAITSGPTCDGTTCSVTVQVTNNTGHRIPSGYPDGRRMWIGLAVKDGDGAVVYESGHYDEVNAILSNSASDPTLTLAQEPAIDVTVANAVMIYERGTCMTPLDQDSNALDVVCDANGITPNVLNKSIAFDNKIPPAGFSYTDYAANGVKFWNYTVNADGLLVPYEDGGRFTDNTDTVIYTFPDPGTGGLTARAELYWQTHTREFMDHLNQGLNAMAAADKGPRPEAPPSIFDPNYPLTPTYISDTIGLAGMTDLEGAPLQDHWGGIAYAAWLETGKGAPFLVGSADTAVTAPPSAPTVMAVVSPVDPLTGIIDANVQNITWSSVSGAEGYLVWVRYGTDEATPSATADWDKLAVVFAPQTTLTHEALNLGKTFQYKAQAFNAAGFSVDSNVIAATTPTGLLLGPINTKVVSVTGTTVTLTWFDQDFNELGFVIERQDVIPGQPLQPFAIVAYAGTPNNGGTGGVNWTDGNALPLCGDVVAIPPSTAGCYTANWTPLQPGQTYNYQISSYNAFGMSTPDLPVAATTIGLPNAPSNLAAVIGGGGSVDLSWTDNSGNETGFRIERSTDGGATFPVTATVGANVNTYSDTTVAPSTTYTYRVIAFNIAGDSLPSNIVTITTPGTTPAAPSGLTATPIPSTVVQPAQPLTVVLTWTDNANNETGFTIQRATDAGFTVGLTTFTINTPNTNAFTDTTVAPKTTYYYRVGAFNLAGTSAWSNTASAVTPGEIPQAPSNLTAKSSGNSVTLSWVDNSNNETGFEIQRVNAGTIIIPVGANVTKYKDTAVTKKTTYTYSVRACNADGCSEFSAPVTITIK
jgi:fibronectin type 3 domain-containing protein